MQLSREELKSKDRHLVQSVLLDKQRDNRLSE